MIIIQVIVILTALLIIISVIKSIDSHHSRAWKKILLIVLAINMIIAVLFPEITNKIANFLGVGRGADLLLYMLTLGVILYALNGYIRHQEDRDRLYRIARRIAIIDANEKYGLRQEHSKRSNR